MPSQNEPRLLWTTPRNPNWSGPGQVRSLENFTGQTLFSVKQHNKLVKLINVLRDLTLIVRTGGGPNDTKNIRAGLQCSDDNSWLELNLDDLLGAVAGLTPYNLVSVQGDYLTCSPTTSGGSNVSVAKAFKQRFILPGVVEYGTVYQFLYSNGTESAVYSAIFGSGYDGFNLLRLKTSDMSAVSFPTSMDGYDKSKGEIEAVIPLWTTTANTPNDVIYAASVTGGVGFNDGAGNPVALLSVGDNRQWAKVDPPLSTVADVLQFSLR